MKKLENLNFHDRDSRIFFDESNHNYTSIKFASKPCMDFIHANEIYASKILNSIIENGGAKAGS